jgi:hypothetical protein
MAFSNYTELQAEIVALANRTGDTEFAALVPGFITQVEMALNNGTETTSALRTREMETSASISMTDGVGSLPNNYLEFIRVVGANGDVLEPAASTWAFRAHRDIAGTPQDFVIEGLNIKTFPISTETITMQFYTVIPPLASNSTNWLLTKYPNIYLYGSLMFAELAQENDQRAATYSQVFQQSVGGLSNSDRRSKFIRAKQRLRGPTP